MKCVIKSLRTQPAMMARSQLRHISEDVKEQPQALERFAFRRTKSRSVRVTSILGLIAVLSAVVGGYLFVFSGFLANGNSAQMGGAFIGA